MRLIMSRLESRVYEWCFLGAYLMAIVPLFMMINKLIFKWLFGALLSGKHWEVPYYLGRYATRPIKCHFEHYRANSLDKSLLLALWATVGNATYSVFVTVHVRPAWLCLCSARLTVLSRTMNLPLCWRRSKSCYSLPLCCAFGNALLATR